MAKEIELPDGSIAEFPDNMDDAAIRGVLQKKFGAHRQQAAPYLPYQNEADPGSDTERFGENPGTGAGGAEFHQGIASTPPGWSSRADALGKVIGCPKSSISPHR